MNTSKLSNLAPLIVALAAALWGIVGIFTKHLYGLGFSPLQTSMLRCFVAAVVIVPVLLFHDRKKMRLHSAKHLLYFVLSGTLGLALCYFAYFTTIQTATLSVAVVMLYSAPIMVTLMAAVLFKEKITPIKMVSLIFAFAGCVLMSGILGGSDVALSWTGLFIGFLSGLGYALYSIGSRMALLHYDTTTVTAYTFIFAVLGLLPLTPIRATVDLFVANPIAIASALGLGLLSTLIPYTIYVLALNYIEVGKAAVLSFIEPVTATVLSVTLFHEALGLNGVIAIILILVSVILMNLKVKQVRDEIIVEEEDFTWRAEDRASERLADAMQKEDNQ